MSSAIRWVLLLAVAALFALIFYNWYLQQQPPLLSPPSKSAPGPDVPAPPEPQSHFPVPEQAEPKALPGLDASDDTISNALASAIGDQALVRVLNLKAFVRNVVATIDNLPRRKLPQRLLPLQPAPGSFDIAGRDNDYHIDARNYQRYAPYIRVAADIDAGKLVTVYFRFYPLFQQAYQDLGYPKGYFNDRLVEVIDHLLAAPEVPTPVKLVRPKVYYEFADAELEQRSAGQKILIRIGPENAAKVKAKLREIRGDLTAAGPKR